MPHTIELNLPQTCDVNEFIQAFKSRCYIETTKTSKNEDVVFTTQFQGKTITSEMDEDQIYKKVFGYTKKQQKIQNIKVKLEQEKQHVIKKIEDFDLIIQSSKSLTEEQQKNLNNSDWMDNYDNISSQELIQAIKIIQSLNENKTSEEIQKMISHIKLFHSVNMGNVQKYMLDIDPIKTQKLFDNNIRKLLSDALCTKYYIS